MQIRKRDPFKLLHFRGWPYPRALPGDSPKTWLLWGPLESGRRAPTCRAPLLPCSAVMVATQQEMNDAQLTLEQRDYCAHHLIRLLKCKRDSFPNFLACKHEQHAWDHCEHLE